MHWCSCHQYHNYVVIKFTNLPAGGMPTFFQNNGRNGTFGFLEVGSRATPRPGGGGGGGPASPGGGEMV